MSQLHTQNSEYFEFVLKRYADADRKMLRDAFLQDPDGDPDSVRWAAVTLCMQTLGFESMTGREFTPDQRKVIPMLQALQEASDGRSWAGDIFGSFLGSVVEIPNRIALSSSAAWKRNVDGEATCDLVFEIWAMRKLAITAPVRDRGFLGNAFVHISFMLPYAGCAIPMQTNP